MIHIEPWHREAVSLEEKKQRLLLHLERGLISPEEFAHQYQRLLSRGAESPMGLLRRVGPALVMTWEWLEEHHEELSALQLLAGRVVVLRSKIQEELHMRHPPMLDINGPLWEKVIQEEFEPPVRFRSFMPGGDAVPAVGSPLTPFWGEVGPVTEESLNKYVRDALNQGQEYLRNLNRILKYIQSIKALPEDQRDPQDPVVEILRRNAPASDQEVEDIMRLLGERPRRT